LQLPAAPVAEETPPVTPGKKAAKKQDPALRVHQRLQADLKWYDISDEDLRIWFSQLRSDGYDRNEANARYVIQRMEQIIAMIQEGRARLEQENNSDHIKKPITKTSKTTS
jgi:hypothetical protein